MARARNIKPAFFKNELLAELPCETRLLFIGLWTLADREGRLEDRPRRIKMELFAYDSFNVDSMLNDLQSSKFLTRYTVDDTNYVQITNFVKHQDPHYREKASEIPPMPGTVNAVVATNITRTQRARILERDDYTCQSCGSKDHPCIDHIIPVSRGGDSSDDNLQVLCLPCNTKKGNKLDSTSTQRRPEVDSTNARDVPLNPDSLIPDSLNLNPDSTSINSAATQTELGEETLAARSDDEITPAGLLSIVMRRAGISSNPGDPRLIALAEQGVKPETVAAACAEAKQARPGERIGVAYVLAILNRWSADAAKVDAGRANQPRAGPGYQSTAEKTKAWADRITGKSRSHEPDDRIIDINERPAAGMG